MTEPRSTLAPFAHLNNEPDPQQAFELCREAWHRDQVFCIRLEGLEKRIGWVAVRMIRNIAEQLFGKRRIAPAPERIEQIARDGVE